MPVPRPKWIKFAEIGSLPGHRTNIWEVVTADLGTGSKHSLGEIRWFGRWRKYCFYPRTDTLFEQTCLRDIADFCGLVTAKQMMTARQKKLELKQEREQS